MTVIREERGWAGHFVAAHRCEFRRNTLLTLGESRIVVSTVGMYMSRGRQVEPIGVNRYYETMAFPAVFEDGFWEAGVGNEIAFNSQWAISEPFKDGEANAMHEEVVRELSERLEAEPEQA